jgi:hypothetical protein
MPKARTGTVYFDHQGSECRDKYHRRCPGRWRGEVTLDDGKRKKLSGDSRQDVLNKLDALRAELTKGIPPEGGPSHHLGRRLTST